MPPFRLAVLMLSTLSVVATAATPTITAMPKPAASPKTPPLTLTPGVKRAVMSPEGRTIAARVYGTPDARITELQAQIADLRQQRMQLISANPIDIDKFEKLLRDEEQFQTELRARTNDRVMTFLRQLPEADRYPALQNMLNPVKPQSSARQPAN